MLRFCRQAANALGGGLFSDACSACSSSRSWRVLASTSHCPGPTKRPSSSTSGPFCGPPRSMVPEREHVVFDLLWNSVGRPHARAHAHRRQPDGRRPGVVGNSSELGLRALHAARVLAGARHLASCGCFCPLFCCWSRWCCAVPGPLPRRCGAEGWMRRVTFVMSHRVMGLGAASWWQACCCACPSVFRC